MPPSKAPRHRAVPALLALLAAGCATAPLPAPPDLEPARSAVAAARTDSTSDPCRVFLARAEEHLARAETLRTSPEPSDRTRAEGLGALAKAEAEAASALAREERERAVAKEPVSAAPDAERERLKARVVKGAEEQRRLEEKVALLQKDLDATETELIRSKAKLKGIETKAEASSAIAEAQILMLRVQDQKNRSAAVARSKEKLERAERQLREGNFGAAVFFALQAQDLLDDARHSAGAQRKK